MAKKAADPESSISLKDVLPAVDRKDREWWDTLNDKQKEKFPAWLYMRYCSAVNGSPDVSRFYVMAVNETVNKRFNTVRKHHQLQYLLMTAASPGIGSQYHQFIPPPAATKGNTKRINLFAKLFPNVGYDELAVMAEVNSEEDLRLYFESLGWTDKEIKLALSKVEDATE